MGPRFNDYTIASKRIKDADGRWAQDVMVKGVKLRVVVRPYERKRNPFNKQWGTIYRATLSRPEAPEQFLASCTGDAGHMTLPRILYATGAEFHAGQASAA